MRIRLVTIRAGIVDNGSLEIAPLMTAPARNIEVLAHQREVSLRVIESPCEVRLLPSERGVAGIASLLEFAFVRIAMAI